MLIQSCRTRILFRLELLAIFYRPGISPCFDSGGRDRPRGTIKLTVAAATFISELRLDRSSCEAWQKEFPFRVVLANHDVVFNFGNPWRFPCCVVGYFALGPRPYFTAERY